MTIRFAAAMRGENPIISRAFSASIHLRASNDDYHGISSDKLMQATLRHFAHHGLSAARRAKESAETAWLAKDFESCTFWLSICRALDRRMADALAARMQATRASGENRQRG